MLLATILAIAGECVLDLQVLAERAFWIDSRPRARERRLELSATAGRQ